ncbi:MAG: hypothetical protein OJI70_10265 [Zavarzinia sp.]|nr:hypothetical protein [Zavarzinia sp.]
MSSSAQKKAIAAYRARLAARGVTRFEVMAPEVDRALIRGLARRLAEKGPQADELRETLGTLVAEEAPKTGGILAALRRSPLVGADLDLDRPRDEGRTVEL